MRIVTYDFESFWRSKDYTLSKMSAIDYIRHPDFHALMLGVAVDQGEPMIFEHEQILDALRVLNSDPDNTMWVAHNGAGFDHLILSEVYGIRPKLLTDTIHLMRWTGVSRVTREALSSMTHYFHTGEKKAGTVVSDGKARKTDFTPQDWQFFCDYCKEDVQQTRDCFMKMLPYMTSDALMFSNITCHMATDAAFVVKPDILADYITKLQEAETNALEEIKHMFKFPDESALMQYIRSAKKFAGLLTLLGVEVPVKFSEKQTETTRKKLEALRDGAPNEVVRRQYEARLNDPESYAVYTPALAKTDLEFLELREHPDPRVRVLVDTRLEHNSSIALNRAQALQRMAGKPIPIMLKAFFAHTSRYGAGNTEGQSDKLQIQNLPKHNKAMKPLRQSITVPDGYSIVAADSSQIEARVLAYEAQQLDLLTQFREGRDPYAEMAARFDPNYTAQQIHDGAKRGDAPTKLLRQIGKKAVLSCLGADTLVYTSNGWKRIIDVEKYDLLWDGWQWQEHKGVAYNGIKEVINLDGVWLTPDHPCLTKEVCAGWSFFNPETLYDWQDAVDLYNSRWSLNFALAVGLEYISNADGDTALCYTIPSWIQKLKTHFIVAGQGDPYKKREPPKTMTIPVFDIIDSGPLHRFCIKTNSGVLVVHNCGYGVGSSKFADTLIREGSKLDPDKEQHNVLAKRYHTIYRSSVPSIVAFWNLCQQVLGAMVVGTSGYFGGPDGKLFEYGLMTICGEETVPSIRLPTGFILRYPNLRVEANERGKSEYWYDRPLGKNTVKTRIYGGACVENCTQALAFQILMTQAVAMRNAGIKLHANIHDSFATVVPTEQAEATLATMIKCMKTVPSYVAGLPLGAEGEIGKDFTIV